MKALTRSRFRPARDIASDLQAFTRKASRIIGIELPAISDVRADPNEIDRLLERLLPAVLQAVEARAGDVAAVRALASMAVEIADLEDEWHQCRQRDAEHGREELASSIVRLRSLRTEQDVADHICEETCRACGSERALFAWIGAGGLLPYRYFRVGVRRARPRPSAAEPLSCLPAEQTVVEHRRTVRVSGADSGPTPAAVQQFMRRSSFVIAPVVAADRVVGLIYAAESASAGSRDQSMLSWLDRFATAVGGHFDLMMLLRRLDAQSAQVSQGLSALQHAMKASETSVDLMQLVGREQSGPTATDTDSWISPLGRPEDEFTARERDVLALLVTGLGNRQIAEQLAIAESTVKSHLQHMLRKAGAVNRSELISQFYSATQPGAGP